MKFFVFSIITVSLIFFTLLIVLNISENYLLSIGLGWLIAFLYIVTGFILFIIALKFKNKSFGKMITISVFGRLIITVGGIALAIKSLDIHNTIFIIALFSFYFIFQIMEVVGLNKISIKGA